MEAGEEGRHNGGHCSREGGDLEVAAVKTQIFGQLGCCGSDSEVYARRVAREQGTGLGQLHASRVSRNQREVEARLCAFEVLGDCRLAVAQGPSGSGHAAALVYLSEDAQSMQVERPSDLFDRHAILFATLHNETL